MLILFRMEIPAMELCVVLQHLPIDAEEAQGGIEELHTIKTSQHYWAVGLLLHGVSINNYFFLTIWIVIQTLVSSILNNGYQDP